MAEDVFRTEALAVQGEYIKNSANPISKLFEQVRAAHYREHTYRHTTMGFLEDIVAMPEQYEYSKMFFDRWYRPEKAAIDPGRGPRIRADVRAGRAVFL
jgi:zinc protease